MAIVDVSVLLTCFKKESYLDECVSSVLRQTKQPKEIIIVHDGCPEPMHHAQATSIFLKDNLGVVRSRHEAFRYSTGSLVLFLDGDDVLSPDYIEKMVLVLADGVDVVYPDLFIWQEGNSSLVVLPDKIEADLVHDINKFPIPVTSLIKRELYEKLGGFRDFPVLEDLDFWLRAMCNGYTFKKAQTLLWYRRTGDTRNSLELAVRKRVLAEIMAQFEFKGKKLLFKNVR